MKRVLFASLFAAVFAVWSFTACKSDEGQRCQVDADCADNLSCNQATGTCSSGGAGMDDADIIDMVPADASADADVDAP